MEYYLSMGLNVLAAFAIFCVGWVAGQYVKKMIHNIKTLDPTLKGFLGGLAKYTIFAVSIVIILQQFGVQTASLLAVLGAAGLAIGLALQGTLSNVSAGVMLLILRPFNTGDFISCNGATGTVQTLGLFATELSTPDNLYIFVPNGNLWNANIQNFSRNSVRRQDLVFGIGYNEDINQAFKTIESVVSAEARIMKDDDGKKPQIMVTNLGESSVEITLRVWTQSADFFTLKVDMHKAVKEALDKDGVNIPFPTRTLELSVTDLETLKDATTSKKKAA